MKLAAFVRPAVLLLLSLALAGPSGAAEADAGALAHKAQDVLKANCHRCHGQDGSVEGGMNYVLDLEKLVARRKVVAGKADESPLFRRVESGKMPPPGANPRPTEADVAVLRQWIEAGAHPIPETVAHRPFVSDAEVFARILADLDKVEKRSRRFTRYFTLTHLANAGLGDDELQTYRNALAKLLNSLSWHPRIRAPQPADADRTILRIDLRDFQWDANLWNRILAEYPTGLFPETATARACAAATGTRLPCVRADWFIATASRPPLYVDLLQLPTTAAELERQLRVDVLVDIQQERVARAGFNGSGISRNNRVLERHDAVHGAYWRTYDFEAVPQNLVERQNLLPDRRNLFAYPLGPGISENVFQHAGGEVIFNLPNGLQGYMLVNANNQRIDKANVAIVSDPKRPDRAVETGVSCMGCHYRGINSKADQVRDYVERNPKAFSRANAEAIKALYVPEAKMKALMDEDAERFRTALEKTGNKVSAAEPVLTCTLRYEADLDLATAAAELGLTPADFLARAGGAEALARNLGALKLPGGTVSRQVFIQSFGDVVKELRLGLLFDAASAGQLLPDNTGELDPLEAQSGQANGVAFSADGKRALFAGPDRSVRLWDVEAERELRRFIGHTASVWSVAFSGEGTRALSGSADGTVRLWDVDRGRELRRLDGHTGIVTAVAFAPEGRRALSGGYDHAVILWDLEKGEALRTFPDLARYVNAVAFAPDGCRCLVAGENVIHLLDLETGKELRRLEGHTDSVTGVAFAPDGRRALSASDDRTVRLWDLDAGRVLRSLPGHTGYVKSVAFAPDGRRGLSGGFDQTVRLWDVDSGQEVKKFTRHTDSVLGVAFTVDGKRILSAGRDSAVRTWKLEQAPAAAPRDAPARGETPFDVVVEKDIKVAVRDGTRLALDLYLPAQDGKVVKGGHPTLMARTPYNKAGVAAEARWFAARGYAVVVNDVRGRYASEGRWRMLLDDPDDGYDVAAWVGKQPWSSGKVGTFGTSYVGGTQHALACARPPQLACMIPADSVSNAGIAGIRHDGAFELRFMNWIFTIGAPNAREALADPRLKEALEQNGKLMPQHLLRLPVRPGATPLKHVPDYERWLVEVMRHGDYDDYWKQPGYSVVDNVERYADVPVYHVTGWYDSWCRQNVMNWQALSKAKKSPQLLIVGPWTHGSQGKNYAGEIEFPPEAALEFNEWRLRWFDHWLRATDNGVEREGPVRLFVMGGGDGRKSAEGRLRHGGNWREEKTFPLERTRSTPYYLHADGTLRAERPAEKNGATAFRFDPENPVPTIGGNLSSVGGLLDAGGFDQRCRPGTLFAKDQLPLSERRDVLVFQTEPLAEDVEVTGPVTVNLFVSSSAVDTDFTAKLLDVYPPNPDYPLGFDLNIGDSITRMRYRDSLEKAELMKPGEIYKVAINLYPTANVFARGHRIRLDLSSSNFPRFDVNPNTGEPLQQHRRMIAADNAVYHSAAQPSHVVLPVIPRAKP